MPAGGYQKPRNPAAVSGPGKLSRRTDGGPSTASSGALDLPYGERGMVEAGEKVAPAQSPSSSGSPRPRPNPSSPGRGGGLPPELFQESSRPNEDGTAGMDMGPGPGSEVLQTRPTEDPVEAALNYFAQRYNFLEAQEAIAEYRGNRSVGVSGLPGPGQGLQGPPAGGPVEQPATPEPVVDGGDALGLRLGDSPDDSDTGGSLLEDEEGAF